MNLTLNPPDADARHQRVIPFRRAANFRDHGGYETTDGRTVRWGLLYRSGHLANLTSRDLKRFASLNIHTLIDFRAQLEKERDPNRLPEGHNIRIVPLPMLDSGNTVLVKEVSDRVKNNDFDGFEPDDVMLETYRRVPINYAEQYKQFVRTVIEAEGQPVLWHCTAGKDRTGFASAVMLRLLGIDLETALQDYMLSGKYVSRNRRMLWTIRLLRGRHVVEKIKPLMKVNESWARAAFQTIDETWGNFDAYRRDALGVSDGDIRQLRAWYLKK